MTPSWSIQERAPVRSQTFHVVVDVLDRLFDLPESPPVAAVNAEGEQEHRIPRAWTEKKNPAGFCLIYFF